MMSSAWIQIHSTAFLIIAALLPANLMARSQNVNAFLYDEVRVQRQVGIGISQHERREDDNVYQKARQISLSGEWSFTDWFSLYLKVPYSDLTRTDSGKVDYFDHIRIGTKFEGGWQHFGFVGGLYGDLARGHEKAGDVPHNYGYLEPYGGMYVDFDWFYATGAIRWNTETNPKFREVGEEDFRRRWFYDVSLGFRIYSFTLGADVRYHNLYDPYDQIKKFLEISPGVDWHIGQGFHVSLAGIFYTASESKNKGIAFAFRKFID